MKTEKFSLKTCDSKHNLTEKSGNIEKANTKNIVKYNLFGLLTMVFHMTTLWLTDFR